MADSTIKVGLEVDPSGLDGKVESALKTAGKAGGDALEQGVAEGAEGAKSSTEGLSAFMLAKSQVIANAVTAAASAAVSAVASGTQAIVGGAVEQYAAYEQNVGGIQKIFGNMGQTLEEYAAANGTTTDACAAEWQALESAQSQVLADASNAYAEAGMSANQYMEQVTGFSASLVSSLGGDTQAAAELAHTAMVDMADNVNTFGSSMTDVQNAYQGFAKQNYTMLDNLKLGYGGTQAEMQRLIQDAAAVSDSVDADSLSFDNCVQAIHVMQQEMSISGTTAREAAGTIEGSVSQMKAAWDNWLTGLGDYDSDMGALTDQLVSSFENVAANIIPRVGFVVQQVIAELPGMVSEVGPQVAAAIVDIFNSNEIAEGLRNALPESFAPAIQALDGLADQIAPAFEALPGVLDSVGSAVGGVVSSITAAASPLVTYFAAQMLPALVSFASGVVSAFSGVLPVVMNLGQTVQSIGAAALPVLQNGFALIMPLVGQVISLVMQLASAVSPLMSQVTAALMPALTSIGTALMNLAGAVLPGLAAAAQVVLSVIQALMPIIQTVLSVVGSVLAVVITGVAQVVSVVTNVAAVVASVFSAIMAAVSAFVAFVSGIVASILGVVGGGVSSIAALVSGAVSTVVSLFGSMVSTALSIVSGLVSSIASFFGSIVSTVASAGSSAYSALTGAFNSMVGGVSGAVGSVIGVVSGIPGQILSALGNVGSLLYNAGASIINGLLDGIKAAISSVYSFVSGIAGTIASLKGPLPYDRRVLIPNGEALMGSLLTGLRGGFEEVQDYVASMADGLSESIGVSVSAKGADLGAVAAAAMGSVQLKAAAASATINQTVNFNQPVTTPDALARTMRAQARYGLAGSF